MMERPEYRLRVLAGFFLVENFKVQSSRTVIFDNLWKFTGISVKYKTQIGTNGHKLSKILLFKSQATILNSQFSILNSKKAPTLLKNSTLLKTSHFTWFSTI